MNTRLYEPALGPLMAPTVNWLPAAMFYGIYLTGLFVFAVKPALSANQPMLGCRYGALFGLFAYATYDLTNQATLVHWWWTVTLVDLAWGCVVSGVSSLAAATVALRLASESRS